jgi:hypothetical protein
MSGKSIATKPGDVHRSIANFIDNTNNRSWEMTFMRNDPHELSPYTI